MPELTISDYQSRVDQWVRKYGVRYFSEMTNLAILMEEVGEVARLMARIFGEQSFKSGEERSRGDQLADELADVLFVLTCIANQTGVNLTEAIRINLEKKTRRDQHRHVNNPKLHSNGG